MRGLLRDWLQDTKGVGKIAGAGHCRCASIVAVAVFIGIVIDLDHYKDDVEMPLWEGLSHAFATCGLMQYLHALTLTSVPAIVVLLVCGLARTRRLRSGDEPFFERLEVVDAPGISKLHAVVFWFGIAAWVIYLVVGPWLLNNAGYEFSGSDYQWSYLQHAYGLNAMSAVSSIGGDILLAVVALLGTFVFELLRRLWKQKKDDRQIDVIPAADVEDRREQGDRKKGAG